MQDTKNPYCAYPACSGITCPYPNLHPPHDLPEAVKRWWPYLSYRKHWDVATQLLAAEELSALERGEHSCGEHCHWTHFAGQKVCLILDTIVAKKNIARWHGWVLGKYERILKDRSSKSEFKKIIDGGNTFYIKTDEIALVCGDKTGSQIYFKGLSNGNSGVVLNKPVEEMMQLLFHT